MSDEIVEQLRGCQLFTGMSNGALKSIAKSMKHTEHAAGHYVLEEGRTPLGMHVILDGTATVEIDGKKARTLGKGDYFGIVSAIDGKPRSASVRADTELKTLALSPWQFRPLIKEQPTLAEELLLALCALLRSSEEGSHPAQI